MKFRLTFGLIIAGLLLMFFGGRGLLFSVLPAQEIYNDDCDWTKLHANQRVHAYLDFVIDPFMETTEDGRSVSQIYTVPDLRVKEDNKIYMTHYMGVLVNSSDYSQYDSLVEASWAWWDMEYDELGSQGYIEFDGYLRKMSKKEKGFLRDCLMDTGYTEEEAEEAIIPYVMMKNQTPLSSLLMFGGGILCLIPGAILCVVFFVLKK